MCDLIFLFASLLWSKHCITIIQDKKQNLVAQSPRVPLHIIIPFLTTENNNYPNFYGNRILFFL